jgi:hypothetical protein
MGKAWFILAERTDWEHLSDWFRARQEFTWETWLGLVTPILLIGLLVAVGKWWIGVRTAGLSNGPRVLFREVAAAHRLSWYETWLLKRLARAGGLAYPVHVFLDPAAFKNREAAARLARVWPRIAELERRLFAEPARDE